MNVVVLRQLLTCRHQGRTKWQRTAAPCTKYKASEALYGFGCSCCTEESLNTEAQHFCRDYEECCIVIKL